MHTLGYADDLALANKGGESNAEEISARITRISEGSRNDADMDVSLPKTKVLHVCEQETVSKTSVEEASKICKYVCDNEGCNHVFHSLKGLKIHKSKCSHHNTFEVEKILDCKGPTLNRKYLIRWKGYSEADDTWEPRHNLTGSATLIKEFEIYHGIYDSSWAHRCDVCDQPCKSSRGVKIHKTKAHSQLPPQRFEGSVADQKVKLGKLKGRAAKISTENHMRR